MDDFLAYLADTVESHFIKNPDFNGTVLGTIVLTAYKETNQQIINLPLELSSIISLICRAVKSVGPFMF